MVRTKTPGMCAYSFVHATLARRPIRNHAINRSFDRASIHQQKVNTQNGLPSDAPPTPTPTTRLAGRVRIIRASSSRACLFALERRRHHACIHPRASSFIHHHSINHHEYPPPTPTTRLQRDACDGIEPLMSPALFRVLSRIDACASSPVASVGLVPRHTRTRSRSRPRLDGPAATYGDDDAIDDATDARDVVVGVGVDSARATVVESSSSVRRRRGFHSRVRSVSRQIHRRR